MEPAHGTYCDDFPVPTELAQLSPYFGKYARTGSSAPSQLYGNTGGTTTQPQQKYDPRFYEQAPLNQPNNTPPEQVQPQQPAPGNGNGNGNGNGANGNGRGNGNGHANNGNGNGKK
jgi:hypothetical protein